MEYLRRERPIVAPRRGLRIITLGPILRLQLQRLAKPLAKPVAILTRLLGQLMQNLHILLAITIGLQANRRYRTGQLGILRRIKQRQLVGLLP